LLEVDSAQPAKLVPLQAAANNLSRHLRLTTIATAGICSNFYVFKCAATLEDSAQFAGVAGRPCPGWRCPSFPIRQQLRAISSRFFEEEKEKAAVAMSEACSEIQQVMRASLLELVNHLRERLEDQPDGKPQRLRESTVQKLRDFLATFDLRNVVDDRELKEQAEKARSLLEGVSTDALRNMPLVRASVREGTAQLAAQMDVLVSDRVSRKFRFDES
jgi:hypothetical protein